MKQTSNTTTVELDSGIKVHLDANIMSKNMITRIRSGQYEIAESRLLPNIIEEGEVVLEIGGGIGYISALVAKNPKVKTVHTYEANPYLIDVINKTHELNDTSCHAVNGVLLPNPDASTKDIDFFIRHDFWASSLAPEPWGYKEKVKVPVFDLEKIVSTVKPSLLIVDIEGGEIEFFENVELAGVKKIFIELHPRVIGKKGMDLVFDTLSNMGFHYDKWHSDNNVVLFSDTKKGFLAVLKNYFAWFFNKYLSLNLSQK